MLNVWPPADRSAAAWSKGPANTSSDDDSNRLALAGSPPTPTAWPRSPASSTAKTGTTTGINGKYKKCHNPLLHPWWAGKLTVAVVRAYTGGILKELSPGAPIVSVGVEFAASDLPSGSFWLGMPQNRPIPEVGNRRLRRTKLPRQYRLSYAPAFASAVDFARKELNP